MNIRKHHHLDTGRQCPEELTAVGTPYPSLAQAQIILKTSTERGHGHDGPFLGTGLLISNW